MKLKVRNLDIVYGSNGDVTGMNVRYDYQDNTGFQINGLVRITEEEYSLADDIEALATIALGKLKESISAL